MAKKEKKAKQDGPPASDPIDMIRKAIERTVQASAESAGVTQKRTRELVDDIQGAASRIRQTLEDLRVLDEVREMRTQIEALSARVAELEAKARPRASGTRASSSTRTSGTRGTRAASGTRSASKRSGATATKRTTTTRRSAASGGGSAANGKGAGEASSPGGGGSSSS